MYDFTQNKVNANSIAQRKLVFGVGVGINDADYVTSSTAGGKCPYYQKWRDMIKRAHSEKFHEKNPTYKNCTVSEEWKTFSNFRKWMVEQDWNGNQLDKDFINPGNKHYSKENCLFIPAKLNSILGSSKAKRGKHPQGVSFHKSTKKFTAYISISRKVKHLGLFNTPEEAEITYNKTFNRKIQELIDQNTYPVATEYLHKHFK